MKSRKAISILLTISIIVSVAGISAYAKPTTTTTTATTEVQQESTTQEQTTLTIEEAQKQLEEQRKDLEERIKENEKKLSEFEESAKTTAEYIEALDEKIGLINQELDILDQDVKTARRKVKKLDGQIRTLETNLKNVTDSYNQAQDDLADLQNEFTTTYNAYCLRLRAMYISGSDSVLVALLTSHDLAQLFNRYEMIKAIAKSDTQLLKEVNEKMDGVNAKKAEIAKEKAALEGDAKTLDVKRKELASAQAKIETNLNAIAQKKVALAEDRAESDALYAQYTADTQMYSEYKYEDEQLVAQVDQEIDDLISGLKAPDEVTTASADDLDHSSVSTTQPSSDSALYSRSDAVLNLTYPAPGHYAVSQYFGHYRNGKAHTGIDFPYPTGSKVVAAQKGIVITVKRLNYSYGYYIMIYHGTDAKGRKIVTLYAHNSSILVSNGQTVEKGQQIAKGGSTGNSTGPHCHFELIIDGVKVNPKNYLSK